VSLASDVDTLTQWARMESPTRDAARVNAMGELMLAALDSDAVAVERIPGRDGLGDMLVLRAGRGAGPPGLVIGHLDTVHPVGTAVGGLPVRQAGERLYGPGVYDMKGGLLIGLQALLDVARAGTATRPLIFALAPDEEIGSPTSRAVTEHLAKGAAFALVLEPAREDGSCVTARKAVGRFEIDVAGRASHAGVRHDAGRSAIREAAHQILAVEALTDYAEGVTASVGLVSGGTGVNVVPDHCRFSVDFRAPTALAACRCAETIQGLRSVDPDVSVSVSGGVNRPAYERSPASAALFAAAREIAQAVGFPLAEAPMTGGGSDGNFTAALGVATLDGLGIEGAGAHTLEEYGLPASIAPRRALIRRLLER